MAIKSSRGSRADLRLQTNQPGQSGDRIRAFKRRASKACQCCRERKVRCDALQRGIPCTNCTLDDVVCMVPESRRSNRPKRVEAEPSQTQGIEHHILSSPLSRLEESEPLLSVPGYVQSGGLNRIDGDVRRSPPPDHGEIHAPLVSDMAIAPSLPLSPSPSPSGISIDCVVERDTAFEPHLIYETEPVHGTDSSPTAQEASPNAFSTPPSSHSRSRLNGNPRLSIDQRDFQMDPSNLLHTTCHTLPSYIEPLPTRLSDDDVTYLMRKGALRIPHIDFRNSLLRSYVEFVHPFLPLVELERLLVIIERDNGEEGRLSLLLFQSIMFAASAFVDAEALFAAGYSSRKAARRAFFDRARLLYDLDIERDQITLVQSLVLMAYWFERPADCKNTAQWLSLAISIGQGIGLHRNPNKANSGERQRLRKRIWWSCFMRDRLVALATSRPSRIGLNDCDVPMLTVDDFEILSLSDDLTCVSDCTYLRDQRIQRELALCCVEMAKLCVCIGQVSAVHNSLTNNAQGCATPKFNVRAKMMLLAPNAGSDMSEVQKCDEQLIKWAAELPDDALYRRPTSNIFDESLVVHKARLLMLYFAAILCALHRPLGLQPRPPLDSSHGSELRDLSVKKARLAASEISRICKDLHELDLIRYLPTSGVTSVLLASIIHLRGVKSEDPDVRNASVEQFAHCITCMQGLRDSFFSADYAVYLLEAAVRRINNKNGNPIPNIPPLHSRQHSTGVDLFRPVNQTATELSAQSFSRPMPAVDAAATSSMMFEDDIARQLENMFATIPSDSVYQVDGSIEANPSSYLLPSFADMATGCSYDSTSLFLSNDNFTSPTNIENTFSPFHW